MKKKTIILIMILAASLYILYKRGVFSSKEQGGTSTNPMGDYSTSTNPMDDYRIIIDRTTMPSDVKVVVKTLCKSYWGRAQKRDLGTTNVNGKSVSIYDQEVKTAESYGITLAQQCVRTCITQLENKQKPDGSGPWLTTAQAEAYRFEVQSME